MKNHGLIGGIPVGNAPCPVMPGAGIVKTIEDLEKLLKNDDIQIIEVGAITVEERLGNPGNTYYSDPANRFSVNSVGMSNLGLEKYKRILPHMVEMAHKRRKKLAVNIAAVKDISEYITLIDLCYASKVDIIVPNAGCPNLWASGKQHPPLSLHPTGFESLINEIRIKQNDMQEFLGAKLPPIFIKISPLIKDHSVMRTIRTGETLPSFELDMDLVGNITEILKRYPSVIQAVISTNTIGNVQVLDQNNNPVIGPNPNNPNSTGGLAGKIIHSISVAQAKALVDALKDTPIEVIGAGGVATGKDVYDFIRVGCPLVQIVSEYHRTQDPGIYSQIASEMLIEAAALTGHI